MSSDSKDVDAKETLELANTNESSVSEPKDVRVNPKGKAPKMTADNDDDEGSDDDGNFAEDSDEDDDEDEETASDDDDDDGDDDADAKWDDLDSAAGGDTSSSSSSTSSSSSSSSSSDPSAAQPKTKVTSVVVLDSKFTLSSPFFHFQPFLRVSFACMADYCMPLLLSK